MSNDNNSNAAAIAASSKDSEVVCISYDDLVATCNGSSSQNHDAFIERAFSSTGLGIIAITDVPNLPQLRLRLLPLAQKLATLSPEHLEEITIHEADYQVGWVSSIQS